MSRLIYQGNLEKNFGIKLPAPYIERVYIKSSVSNDFSENTSDGLQVDLAILLPEIENEEPTEAREAINDLYVYAGFIIGNEEITNVVSRGLVIAGYLKRCPVSGKTVEELRAGYAYWSSLIDYTYSIPIAEIDSTVSELDQYVYILQNYTQVNFSDFSEEPEKEFFDEETNTQYFKYTASLIVPMYGDHDNWYDLFSAAYESDEGDISYKDLSVFAFSSIADLNNKYATTGDVSPYAIQSFLENESTNTKLHSDIAYENIWEGGSLLIEPQLKFFDSAGLIYDGVPVQLMGGSYHKTENLAYSAIADQIMGIFPTGASTSSEDLGEVVQSIEGIISEYFGSPQLLVKLNEYRKAFPDKNSVSGLGPIYKQFKQKLYNLQKQYSTEEVVTKKLVRNNKIIDIREEDPDTGYEQPEIESDAVTTEGTTPCSDYTNPYRIYGYNDLGLVSTLGGQFTRYAYSSTGVVEDSATVWDYEDNLLTYGVIWFDYEKSLRNETHLAQTFNIDKLETYFGKELTNAGLRFNKTELSRYYESDSQTTIETYYHPGQINHTEIEICAHTDDAAGATNYATIDVGLDGTPDYSYCMLRNCVDDSGQTGGNDYRLACFQFQDYYDVETASDATTSGGDSVETYGFNITMGDYTLEVIETIIASYETMMTLYQEYYEYASENCNYNNVDGAFNSFFIDGVNEYYSDDMTNAPWFRAPVIFNIHRDILMNIFEGNTDLLLENSKQITDNITPESATLEQLRAFNDRIQSLWDSFYAEGTGTIQLLLGEDAENGRDLNYCQEFLEMPAIYYGGETLEEYEEDFFEETGFTTEGMSLYSNLIAWESTMESEIESLFNTVTDENWNEYYGVNGSESGATTWAEALMYVLNTADTSWVEGTTSNARNLESWTMGVLGSYFSMWSTYISTQLGVNVDYFTEWWGQARISTMIVNNSGDSISLESHEGGAEIDRTYWSDVYDTLSYMSSLGFFPYANSASTIFVGDSNKEHINNWAEDCWGTSDECADVGGSAYDEEDTGCVIATHAMSTGGFKPAVKRRAIYWCVKNLHGKWYGEAIRRGYKYYGNKAIDNDRAEDHYQEFQDYINFASGRQRSMRTALTFCYRTVQFFVKGLFIKEDK